MIIRLKLNKKSFHGEMRKRFRRRLGRRTSGRRFFRRFKRGYRRYKKSRGSLRFSRIRFRQLLFPDKTTLKFRWSDTDAFSTSGSYGAYTGPIWRGNSLFDPDYTVGGHKPTSFDQWGAFYTQYRVMASKISVKVTRQSTTAGDDLTIWLLPSTEPSIGAGASPTTWLPEEQAMCRWKHGIPPVVGGNKGAFTLKHYMTTKKLFPGESVSTSDFTAPFTAHPTGTWYWVTGFTNTGSPDNIRYYVTITYYAQLFDRLNSLQLGA